MAALADINEQSGQSIFTISHNILFKLLAALNECTEWGQVFILDSLVSYPARDARDAEAIVERVTPRLQHANCAVVLSAVKVIMKNLEQITAPESVAALIKKMAPPLVTLLSSEPEIQYVALRNINLIIQRRKNILTNEIKVGRAACFFFFHACGCGMVVSFLARHGARLWQREGVSV